MRQLRDRDPISPTGYRIGNRAVRMSVSVVLMLKLLSLEELAHSEAELAVVAAGAEL